MSSNPFRKAAGAQVGSQFAASDALHLDTMPASTLPPPKTSFRADDYDHGDDDEGSAADEAPGKKKVVKKAAVAKKTANKKVVSAKKTVARKATAVKKAVKKATRK